MKHQILHLVPHDDLRLKKAAAIALKSWNEELCQARKQAGMNGENTNSSDNLEEHISGKGHCCQLGSS